MTRKNQASQILPLFLDGTAGRLFAIYRAPPTAPRQAVLFLPPFAEELNKCRRMMTLQAEMLTRLGIGGMVIDLYGTGDSEGYFDDARWDIWLNDVGTGIKWLREQGIEQVILLGVRVGALVAAHAAQVMTQPIDKLVFWAPVLRGEAFLTQFLRMRLAADLTRDGDRTTTQDLRNTLAAGKTVEVAGYGLAPELAASLAATDLRTFAAPGLPPVVWLEVSSNSERGLTPASSAVLDAFQQAGIPVDAEVVKGDPFWATSEIATAPLLLERTCHHLYNIGHMHG